MIWHFRWYLWGLEVIVSVTIASQTPKSRLHKQLYVDGSLCSFLALWRQRRNVEARKQTSVANGAVFPEVWSWTAPELRTISRDAKRDKHLLIY